MKQLAGTATTLLSGVVAVVTLVVVIGTVTGQMRLLPVLSGSMAPEYPTGSAVVVTPEPVSALRVDQVVVYHIPVLDHHLVMHRVVNVRAAGARPVITTRGDANSTADPWRARLSADTVWIARGDVPWAGYAIVALRSPITIIGIVLMLGAFAVARTAVGQRHRDDHGDVEFDNDIWWRG